MNKYLRYLREYTLRSVEAFTLFAFLLLVAATPAQANTSAPSGTGGVLNILMLGVIAYFLVRMFRRRMGGGNKDDKTRPGNWSAKDGDSEENQGQQGGRVIRPMDRHEAARQMWGHLSSEKEAPQQAPEQAPPQAPETPKVAAAGFDENEFLEGAKLFFSRFQQASDSREFDDLKMFLSDEVYTDAVLKAQQQAAPVRTEIMLLNARLMELKTEGGRTNATVFYDGQIRKGASGEQPEHVRAVWEYSRDDSVENGLWTLEKINKVDQ